MQFYFLGFWNKKDIDRLYEWIKDAADPNNAADMKALATIENMRFYAQTYKNA